MFMNQGLKSFARYLAANWLSIRGGKRQLRKRAILRSGIETREDRQLLTNFVVTTAADDSTADSVLSLREAIDSANANVGADTITFDSSLSGQRLLLTQGQLVITDPLTITGLGSFNTVIDAQLNSRVFSITDTAGDVTLDSLTATGGRTNVNVLSGSGAGIYYGAAGTLRLDNSTVTANATLGSNSQGGGIYSFNGAVLLFDSTVS
jgi:CSLREA domain-containing protein